MRFFLSILLLLAILVRASVPDGYMVEANGKGSFEIIICTDGGTATLMIDASDNPGKQGGQSQETCPFSLSATSVLAMEQAQPEFTSARRSLQRWVTEDQRARIAIVAANAARAPPHTV